jgi:hypothetical protein
MQARFFREFSNLKFLKENNNHQHWVQPVKRKTYFRKNELLSYFDACCCGNDVTNAKPDRKVSNGCKTIELENSIVFFEIQWRGTCEWK